MTENALDPASSPLRVDIRVEGRINGFCLRIFGDTGQNALRENGRYEYELSSTEFSLREVPGVIRHSRIQHDCERGTIEPGNYVGLLKLALVEKLTGTAGCCCALSPTGLAFFQVNVWLKKGIPAGLPNPFIWSLK